mmetsp:Transcript_15732/g.46484  ORF Transcript_15732/g.46484 Transcript_15732/m.46484 type:complete len:221 (+) Transcript_15732:1961-2623(+)
MGPKSNSSMCRRVRRIHCSTWPIDGLAVSVCLNKDIMGVSKSTKRVAQSQNSLFSRTFCTHAARFFTDGLRAQANHSASFSMAKMAGFNSSSLPSINTLVPNLVLPGLSSSLSLCSLDMRLENIRTRACGLWWFRRNLTHWRAFLSHLAAHPSLPTSFSIRFTPCVEHRTQKTPGKVFCSSLAAASLAVAESVMQQTTFSAPYMSICTLSRSARNLASLS